MDDLIRNTSFDILPLTGNVGAELLNIDLARPQSQQTWDDIFAAFSRFGVIFFRDQDLTPKQQLDVATHFGELSASPRVVHVDEFQALGEVRKEPDQLDNNGNNWHTDQSAREHPVRGTLLYAKEVPASGGDTCFISTAVAYDALSDGLKRTLEGLRSIHSDWYIVQKVGNGSDANNVTPPGPMPEATHPVVITLPDSGRKALYVNPQRSTHFEGWTREESAGLLNYLFQHCQRPEFACRFRWRKGSMAFWDDYQTWHYAVNDYHGQRRLMHRTTVVAELWK